jgi:acyl-CoA synthetase (AMP-forming)/AMP-acid ligase II
VRLCASGGDPIPRHILDRLASTFVAEFTDAYGMTEASSCLTLLRGDELSRQHGFAGKALPYTHIKIVNMEGGEAEANEIGEIVIAGPTVMQGYWGKPQQTEHVFSGGCFRTGDLGRIDGEGYLQVLGRSTDVIVTDAARRIFPSEIELVLREHPAVEEVAVTGMRRKATGETIAAWVVLRERAPTTVPDLAAYCAKMLVKEKRPREIFVCKVLPRNSNGKVIKAKLQEACRAG